MATAREIYISNQLHQNYRFLFDFNTDEKCANISTETVDK